MRYNRYVRANPVNVNEIILSERQKEYRLVSSLVEEAKQKELKE